MSNVVYKLGVTDTALISNYDDAAAALDAMGKGLKTGHVRFESGSLYVLVRSADAIADGLTAALSLGNSETDGELSVLLTAATGGPVFCVNNTGGDIAADTYFWGLFFGVGYGYATDGSITAGMDLMVSATDGELDEWASGANQARVAIALETPATDTLFDIFMTGSLLNLATTGEGSTVGLPFGGVA